MRTHKKPDWAIVEIIRLKALMPDTGCRTLADLFNRRFATQRVSVGKTWVSYTLQQHRHAVMFKRKELKNKAPYQVTPFHYWGMDLTGVTDQQGITHTVLGLCEHHSRKALCLSKLRDKASVTLVRAICSAIELYGKPRIIRTDNEAVFTSRTFRWALKFLGIKYQCTELGYPWQNGRIERLFGTFKRHIRKIIVEDGIALNQRLAEFQFWYNTIRPHQNLKGHTPDEIWHGKAIPQTKNWIYIEFWTGVLQGFYARE
ncbi:integrase core domain-containing protein [Rheinheimera soli]|uniref:Transposase InsO family protein n=1 Tax=Rheinheimera soli TaxID=443616 RepID=A0ABU1W5D6_9GAMM|nr:integrase core domain-containing protein [Rheinheimera soli]MDR7123164.1 transposase InsO family protein [Rheinheimera soli]